MHLLILFFFFPRKIIIRSCKNSFQILLVLPPGTPSVFFKIKFTSRFITISIIIYMRGIAIFLYDGRLLFVIFYKYCRNRLNLN